MEQCADLDTGSERFLIKKVRQIYETLVAFCKNIIIHENAISFLLTGQPFPCLNKTEQEVA